MQAREALVVLLVHPGCDFLPRDELVLQLVGQVVEVEFHEVKVVVVASKMKHLEMIFFL